jgi:hypothetical protein
MRRYGVDFRKRAGGENRGACLTGEALGRQVEIKGDRTTGEAQEAVAEALDHRADAGPQRGVNARPGLAERSLSGRQIEIPREVLTVERKWRSARLVWKGLQVGLAEHSVHVVTPRCNRSRARTLAMRALPMLGIRVRPCAPGWPCVR